MDANTISSIISQVGFPVAMCCALFWYMTEQNKAHSEESTTMRDAITKLELAITKLTERLGGAKE